MEGPGLGIKRTRDLRQRIHGFNAATESLDWITLLRADETALVRLPRPSQGTEQNTTPSSIQPSMAAICAGSEVKRWLESFWAARLL